MCVICHHTATKSPLIRVSIWGETATVQLVVRSECHLNFGSSLSLPKRNFPAPPHFSPSLQAVCLLPTNLLQPQEVPTLWKSFSWIQQRILEPTVEVAAPSSHFWWSYSILQLDNIWSTGVPQQQSQFTPKLQE